jgi:integrase
MVEELRRHRGEQAEPRLAVGPEVYQDQGLVVANEDASWVTPDALSNAFFDFVVTVDVPRVTFHGLRHSANTGLLSMGGSLQAAQERMGHSTPMLTLGTYGHLLPTVQDEAAGLIDQWLRGADDARETATERSNVNKW